MIIQGAHYSPVTYFSLGRVFPRRRLREPFPFRKHRFNPDIFTRGLAPVCRTIQLRPDESDGYRVRPEVSTSSRLRNDSTDSYRPRPSECQGER